MSAAATLFTLAAILQLDKSKYEKGLEEAQTDAEKGGSKISKALGNAFKLAGKAAVAGLGTAGAAVSKLVKDSVAEFAEYEQLVGGAQKIFDEMDYSTIEKDAKEAYKTMNLSASEYLAMINQVGATFSATMGDKKGYETAKTGMKAISDYASGTGRNINELNEKFSAITRSASSYQSIADQFSGVLPATSADFLKQAQSAGILKDSYTSLTEVPIAEYQEAISKMLEKGVDDLGLQDNAYKESEKTISGSLAAMKASWQNLVTGLADPNADLGELISTMVDTAKTALKNIAPAIKQALKGLTTLIKELAPIVSKELPGLVNDILPQAISVVTDLFNGLVDALPALMQVIISALPDLLNTVISAVVELTPKLVELAGQLIQGLLSGLTQALPTLIEQLPELIDTVISSVLESLPKIMDLALNLILALANGLLKALPKLIAKLPKIITSIVKFFAENQPKIIAAGVKLFVSLIKNLPQIIVEIVKAIPKIIAGLVSGIVGSVGQIASAGFKLFKGLVTKIPEAISHIVSKIPSVISGIVKAFAKAPSKMADIGKNLIKGLWNGITGVKDWILDKIGGFTSSVLSSIKGFFGIHSPSRVMRNEVGKMLGLGMAEGIEDSAGDVDDAMSSLMKIPEPYNFDSMTLKKNSTGSTAAAGSTGSLYEALQKILDILPELANSKIYLDTGALVGQTAGAYNDALGILVSREERSV